MKIISWLFLFLCIVVLSGCGAIKHDYVWNKYEIAPAKWTPQDEFTEGQEIKVIEGNADTSNKLLGNVGRHQYFGNSQILSKGIVEHLAIELQRKNMGIKDTAKKSMEIIVNSSNFEPGTWKIAATLDYMVKFGNGTQKSFTVRNSTPATVDRLYDGLIANAVIQIIKDPEVKQYLKN
jgi:hypothetical protein